MRSITISGSIKVNNALGVVGLSPVAVPSIFVVDKATSSSADRCHSLWSLFPPQAALPSLPLRYVISYNNSPWQMPRGVSLLFHCYGFESCHRNRKVQNLPKQVLDF